MEGTFVTPTAVCAAKYESLVLEHPQAKHHSHQGALQEQHLQNVKYSKFTEELFSGMKQR